MLGLGLGLGLELGYIRIYQGISGYISACQGIIYLY